MIFKTVILNSSALRSGPKLFVNYATDDVTNNRLHIFNFLAIWIREDSRLSILISYSLM